jgi:hypothetical protein
MPSIVTSPGRSAKTATSKAIVSKATTSKTTPSKAANSVALTTAWAALGKIANKEGSRAALKAGLTHKVNLAILGEVDGKRVGVEFAAELTVGQDSVRASSVTPAVDHILACIIDKLNKTTRERILRELPEAFAKNGDSLPEVEKPLIDAAGNMLARLRAKVSQPVKGSVACKYRLIG